MSSIDNIILKLAIINKRRLDRFDD